MQDRRRGEKKNREEGQGKKKEEEQLRVYFENGSIGPNFLKSGNFKDKNFILFFSHSLATLIKG